MSSANPLTVFGIRHHGPGSAHNLLRGLEELRPDALLVEGPPDAQDLIPWIANPDLRPPVAILVYVPDQPQQAVYYPFAEFSPEWQALCYALRANIPVQFMDLPQAYQISSSFQESGEGGDTGGAVPAVPERRRMDPLQWLADNAGYEDGERFWERLVEQRQGESLGIFSGIQEIMAALRSDLESLDSPGSPIQIGTDLEAERESFMRQSIRQMAADGYQNIAVVCGAWHTPALIHCLDEDPSTIRRDETFLTQRLKSLNKVKVSAAWTPWTYARLSDQSGYGAGVESPGWYELLWEAARTGLNPREITIRWLTLAAHLLREQDLGASSAHIIEAVRLAETLSALRSHTIPALPELNEALQAIYCFGDALPLRLIHSKLIVGERLGSIPADVPQTPLQADLAAQQKRLRLPPEAGIRELDLDLRKSNDLERSYLLHRLNLLGIDWGLEQQVRGKSGTFHEVWRLEWKPELSLRIIESSLWGNTIPSAAIARIRQRTGQSVSLMDLTGLVNQVLWADLPEAVSILMTRLEAEAALASDVGIMMASLPALAEALRYGNVRGTDQTLIVQVVDNLVVRICIGLPAACASLDNDSANQMFIHLNLVDRTLNLLQNAVYLESWHTALISLADQKGMHGLIAGRACIRLMEAGIFTSPDVARRLSRALSTASDPAQAAAWIDGLLRDSGAVLIHEDQLWLVLDEWVMSLSPTQFNPLFPLLRRTFSTFTPPERHMIGERARQGTRPVQPAASNPINFDLLRAEASLPLLASLLGLDVTGGPHDQ